MSAPDSREEAPEGGELNHEDEEPELVSPVEILEEAVREGNADRAAEVVQVLKASSWRGPLPDPETMAEYEKVLPGLAERIVGLTERQSAHRQEIEKKAVDASVKTLGRGQIFAFIIAMTAIIGGVVLISLGYDGAGLATILVPLTPIIGAFIYNQVRRERQENGDPPGSELDTTE